jgi:hypothetical protein
MNDTIDAETSAAPYIHQLPDGTSITIPHEVTLPAVGKDVAAQAFDARGNRGYAVELLRLALGKEFGRLEKLTDSQFFSLFNGWFEHCKLNAGESDASTS